MDFLLRIFFSGLVAFVPSTDGRELTVLLLDTHGRAVAGRPKIEHHNPMLIARADGCVGDCTGDRAKVAGFLFADRPASQAADALTTAIGSGGVWALDDVDLSIRNAGLKPALALNRGGAGQPIPADAAERRGFGWVPDLRKVLPTLGTLKPALFAPRPPEGVVVARLRLKSGNVFTYSLIRVDDQVVPIHFRAHGSKRDVPHAQAVAGWVAADIRVPGDTVEIVAKDFDSGKERVMKLTTRSGLMEMAILNLPHFEVPQPGVRRPTPQPGNHFEVFYDLAQKPAARTQRPVPVVGNSKVHKQWDLLHPETERSPLLEAIRLDPGKSPYDVILCPVGQAQRP